MDIYSALLPTLLISVLSTPALTASPVDFESPPTNTSVPSLKSNPGLFHLVHKGMQASVNINTANAETLALELKGIGQKRAQAIIAYREQHGPFKSIDELTQVHGISKKIVDRNREKITI
jgi:competence protein ComEA